MPENIREIFTRICNKHDLEVNWQNRADFKPLHGELIIYDKEVDANGNTLELPSDRVTPYTHERLKLGDGVTLVNDLPFIDIKGKDGAQGVSGVYVGSGDMPEGYNVQIDPDGDIEVDLLAKIDAVTEDITEVKNEINEVYKSGSSESKTIMRFDDVAPDSEVNLTWSWTNTADTFKIRGKNLYDLGSDYGVGSSGVSEDGDGPASWEILEDGGIRIHPNSQGEGEIASFDAILPPGTYTLSLSDSEIRRTPEEYQEEGIFSFEVKHAGEQPIPVAAFPGMDEDGYRPTFTLDETTSVCYKLTWYDAGSYNVEEATLYPQIEVGEVTTTYENWTTRRTKAITKGSAISLYSPTTTIYKISGGSFSIETKLGLKSSITEYIQESADSVLADAKTYADEEIAKFDFIKVIDSLPSEGLPNRVYLVPKTDTQTQDLFDEYAWINKGTEESPQYAWEWFTTKQIEVDLTNYATTTAVDAAIIARSKSEHPVGSLYLSTSSTDPNLIFGFGTWQLIAQDRMLIGAGNTYSAGASGGSETHTHDVAFRFASYYNEVVLENHEATGIMSYAENGTKTATGNTRVAYTSADSENNYYNAGTEGNRTSSGQIGVYETVGNTSYESSLPPYLAVFMWQRIA